MIKKLCLTILLLGLPINANKDNKIDYSYLVPEVIEAEKDRTPKEVSIDIKKIINIESSGNPLAYNKFSKARGLMQITPIVLKEWNNFNPSKKYTHKDLFNSEINKKIGIWYFNRIKNHYLPNYGLEKTIENILIAYNHGIKNLSEMEDKKNFESLPFETKDYIKKYRKEN